MRFCIAVSVCFMFLLAVVSYPSLAQVRTAKTAPKAEPTRQQVNGTVRSFQSGETLSGVIVYGLHNIKSAAISDIYGRYTISLPTTVDSLVFSFMGFGNDTVSVVGEKMINVELTEQAMRANEVIVTANSGKQRISQPIAGVERISTGEINKIPVIFGERDILKTIQLLPGVKSGGDGSSGFSVRGGTLGQNLILLDEAPVYNASHLMGFFSTFNSAATKDVAVYKGNFPAQYGGRVSSVVDVTMNDGSTKNYGGNVGVGLISSNASLEGPIQKNKSSFLVTARRTYADVFANFFEEFKGNELYFYDINAKANFEINPKNKIYFSGYLGRDVTALKDKFTMDWGNITGTLRWASTISPRLFSNTIVTYSDYNYDIESVMENYKTKLRSKIEDVAVKQNFSLSVGDRGDFIKFGLHSTHHSITPTRFEDGNFSNSGDKNCRFSWENAVYGSYSGEFGGLFNLEAGLRISSYTIIGNGAYNEYQNGNLTNTTNLAKGEFGKTYVNIEPRISASFLMGKNNSIKVAYGRSSQYLQMLNNSSISMPTDQWMGTSYTIKPLVVDQFSAGFFQYIESAGLDLSVEAYYKWIKNEADYKNGANIFGAEDIESELLFGVGRAYGVELLIKKNVGIFTGWIGYTWSKSERQIDGINNDKWYKSGLDITHELSVVAMFNLGKRWEVSALWCYKTGAPFTVPVGKYYINGAIHYQYSDRNDFRMPAYHRLDIGATYNAPKKGGLQGSWNFSIYNAYGRENPYLIMFKDSPGGKTIAEQVSLFRWVPSVSYNLKFTIK